VKVYHDNVGVESGDIRRCRRDMIEVLRRRVGLLRGKERLMMKMYLENGNTVSQLARLAGVNQSSMYRRIRRLKKRLIHGEYIKCVRMRWKFSKIEMDVAREHFLEGRTYKEIAERHGCTSYRINKIVRTIRGRLGREVRR